MTEKPYLRNFLLSNVHVPFFMMDLYFSVPCLFCTWVLSLSFLFNNHKRRRQKILLSFAPTQNLCCSHRNSLTQRCKNIRAYLFFEFLFLEEQNLGAYSRAKPNRNILQILFLVLWLSFLWNSRRKNLLILDSYIHCTICLHEDSHQIL